MSDHIYFPIKHKSYDYKIGLAPLEQSQACKNHLDLRAYSYYTVANKQICL